MTYILNLGQINRYHDGKGSCVHSNVHEDANESNEHGPIRGSMEEKEGDEDDDDEENGFPDKAHDYRFLVKSNQIK